MNSSDSAFTSSTDSSDEDIIVWKRKIYKSRKDNFDQWDGFEFSYMFRLSKSATRKLLENIRNQIQSNSNRGGAIKAETKLFLTIRFYATGNMLLSVADFVGVSVASASRIIKIVSNVIASLKNDFIIMPESKNELENIAQGFYDLAHFPRCCGAIDCTHTKILSPGGDDAEIFRNRKGYFSLNVQTVSDHTLKIRNIVVRWPGSCHDSTIFNDSRLKLNLENGSFAPFLLIGDIGYSVSRHLLTPLHNANLQKERLYIESVIRTRNVVERSYGVWKRRFPILSLGIKVDLDRTMAIIVATTVLHNMAIEMNEEEMDEVEIPEEDNENKETMLSKLKGNNLGAFLLMKF